MTEDGKTDRAYGSKAAAFGGGLRDGLGAPAIVLGASYVGFGSLVREHGFGLGFSLASTALVWAMPSQVMLVELFVVGSSLTAIFLAVTLTSVRLLPMTMSLLPVIRVPGLGRWKLYLLANLIAVTAWAMAMLRCPKLPPEERLPYFFGLGGMLWFVSILGTAAGWTLSGAVPHSVSIGLVFLTPLYFMLVLLMDLRHRGRTLALIFGAAAGPACHALTPSWGLLIGGVGAGIAAFVADRGLRRRTGP